VPRHLHILGLLLTILTGLVPLGAAAEDPPRVAVLELQGELPTTALSLLSDKVRAGVLDAAQGRDIIVMSRENMAIMAKDMKVDLSCVEGACEVETGRNIGAAIVVSGGVTQMSGVWLCTVKVHRTDTGALISTGDAEAASPLKLRNEIPPLVARLMRKALGTAGPQAQVQLGGESVDFGAIAADARAAGDGPAAATAGAAESLLGGGGGDLAAMAAQAAAQQAARERTEVALAAEETRLAQEAVRLKAVREAEAKRQAQETADLQRRIAAERKRRIAEARTKLLTQADADLQPLIPLLTGPMAPATERALQTYLKRYRTAKITVDGTTESVTIPGISRIYRALVT